MNSSSERKAATADQTYSVTCLDMHLRILKILSKQENEFKKDNQPFLTPGYVEG